MEGGIKAWNGMVATGGPEAGMPYFSPAENIEDIVMLAWALEEGSRRFYQGVEGRLADDQEAAALFGELVKAESHHKSHLVDAYQSITSRQLEAETLQARLGESTQGETMEGGVPVREALEWTEEADLQDILELSMGLEINSYDLYIKMSRAVENRDQQRIFQSLYQEEQQHLRKLAHLLDKRL